MYDLILGCRWVDYMSCAFNKNITFYFTALLLEWGNLLNVPIYYVVYYVWWISSIGRQ